MKKFKTPHHARINMTSVLNFIPSTLRVPHYSSDNLHNWAMVHVAFELGIFLVQKRVKEML